MLARLVQRVLAQAQEIIDKHGPQEQDEGQDPHPEESTETSQPTSKREKKHSKKDRDSSRNVASDRDRGGAVPEASHPPSGSDSDSGSCGSEDELPATKKVRKAKGGDAHAEGDKGRKKRVTFAFSFGEEATQGDGDDDGARSTKKDPSDSAGTSRVAKDGRRSSSAGDEDQGSDSEIESDGDGDGRESDPPRSKKRRKEKAVKDGLTDQARSQARAKAIAVAYERALQVAELLA